MRTIRISIFLVIFLNLIAGAAYATLCKTNNIDQRHVKEVNTMEKEAYASGDYKGYSDYNSRVLACNRKRDSNGKAVEQVFQDPFGYAENLAAKLITGKMHYHGVFPFRYFYQLERKNGSWILTSFLEMHYPSIKHAKKLEVSEHLLDDLGFKCDKEDVVEGNYTSCRLDRDKMIDSKKDKSFESKTVEEHYKEFWRRNIEQFWSKPGFTVKVKFVPEEVSDEKYKELKKADAIWHVRLNHNKTTRAMYKASTLIGRPHPLYTGMDRETIVHEYGHTWGLDDEYQEVVGPEISVLGNYIDAQVELGDDCSNILRSKKGSESSSYIMCQNNFSSSINNDADPDTIPFDFFKEHSKAVYAWIATSRYAISGYCEADSDCGTNQFCDKGTALGVGTNQCKPGHQDHFRICSRGEQCASGFCTTGTCYTPKSAKMGGVCFVDDECLVGHCSSPGGTKGTCVCSKDGECGSGKYCDAGVDLTKNACKDLKSDGEACPAVGGGHSCKSGQCSFGRCYTPDSIAMGGICYVTDACKQGKCSSVPGVQGRCVCKEDDDCGSGSWCNKGLDLNMNSCKPKLKKGEVCGKVGELGVGHRCKSGECKAGFGVNLKCK